MDSGKFKIVKSGYDQIAASYSEDREKFDNWNELNDFCDLIPADARVLDVGCGTGIPIAKYLVERNYALVGIDLSLEMIAAARKNVPRAEFFRMNMIDLDLPTASFDGLVACYSLFHVPREQHRRIFELFRDVLKPSGCMLVSIGSSDWEGTEEYYGVEMYWSHYSPEQTAAIISDCGFRLIFNRKIETNGEVHNWVLAEKD